MTLLGRATRSSGLEGPQPLTSTLLLSWLGGAETDAGVSVTVDSSFEVSAVWRAISLLSGTVAGLDLAVLKEADGTRVTNGAATTLRDPHPIYTAFELWELVMVHLLTWGNAYLLKVYEGGRLKRLLPLRPDKVSVKLVVPRGMRFPTEKIFVVTLENGEQVGMDATEVLHVPGMGYDGVAGMSPITKARQAIGLAKATESYGAKLFKSGTLQSGFLKTDKKLTAEQAEALKSRWQQKQAGLGNAHEVAVLDVGASFESLSIPPDDAQFLQTREFSVVEVARWFGVPPHLLMAMERSTSWGSGLEQQNLALVLFSLRPHTRRIESRITRELLPRTQRAEFQMDPITKGDTSTRYAAYLVARKGKWMSINEIRRKEGLPELDVPDADDPTWEPPASDVTTPGGNTGNPPPPAPGAGDGN